MKGYKVFTNDLRPPVQGGDPVWNGKTPFELPAVELDRGDNDCSHGWNFVKDVKTGLLIAGLWPNGRPSRVFEVEATGDVVERGDKIRTDKLTIVSELSEDVINAAIHDFSAVFKPHTKDMAESQIAWRRALARPLHKKSIVEECLREALDVRGLKDWKLKLYKDAWAARAAWAAWAARAAWAAWDARAARDARDAWDAWAACTVEFAARQKWIEYAPDYLTRGSRKAYENGLAIAIPTAEKTLGWAMEKR